MTERRAEKAPDRVAAEADRKKQEQELTERLVRDRLERALLVGQLPGIADGDLEREQPDNAVDQAPRHEADAREHCERRGTHERVAGTASGLNGCRADGARHGALCTHFRASTRVTVLPCRSALAGRIADAAG